MSTPTEQPHIHDKFRDLIVDAGYTLATVGLFWGAYQLLHILFAAI